MKILLIVCLVFSPLIAMAQMSPGDMPASYRDWTAIEIVLSMAILVFTLVLIIIEALLIIKAQKPWSPASILKVIGLTLIICMSAFLIAAGYNQDQIAPVMGLLGVIAGYLLGEKNASSS